MASGKKNYFRHSFFARNDIKLRTLRDKIGIGFYFYFFSLLEQCGESSCETLRENYEFHDSIIRSLWGVNLKKSERVANEMMSVGLLLFQKRENTFYFEIPNLSKYLGKYESKLQPNTSNKRKENKSKVVVENNAHENQETFEISDKIMQVLKVQHMYPENIIAEIARDAWLIFLGTDPRTRKWDRFLTHYFVNEKEKIREKAIELSSQSIEEMSYSDLTKRLFAEADNV